MRNRFYNRKKSPVSHSLETEIPISLNFSVAPTICNVSLAILKYDKDFAHSFTFDDCLISALTSGYKVLAGGVADDSITYPALYYTDGCGNSKLFRAGIAYYTVNSSGSDIHISTPSYLSYSQINTLKSAGWSIMNHSWSHANGTGDTPGYSGVGHPTYAVEIENNRLALVANIGEAWPHFIVPAGDLAYDPYVVAAGMKAIYNQAGANYYGGTGGFQLDGIGFESPMRIFRVFRQETDTYPTVKNFIDAVASKSINGAKFWFNDATHSLTPALFNGGMTVADFASYMGYVASTYGAAGSDRVWMAPLQDVWEYVNLRENTRLEIPLFTTTTQAVISLFHAVPTTDSKTFGWTLKITSDQNISSVSVPTGYAATFKGTGTNKIINVEKV
ncbi:MAG: polysaccharide deacetylase family protein [Cytophagaceae bacterium]|nr:polysaccharide deacetylase family protein [Cytophagaceae bacterium]